jgi:hypothetical protein
MIRQLVVRNRSYRRFKEQTRISKQTLRDLVELARVSASAANLQNLRYWLVDHPDQRLFDCLKWANYLKDWDGPIPGERPSAYIVILAPRCCSKYSFIDTGIACQSSDRRHWSRRQYRVLERRTGSSSRSQTQT